MRRFILFVLIMAALFTQGAAAADKTIHGLTRQMAILDSMYLEIEGIYGGNWISRYIPFRQLISLARDTTMSGSYATGKIGMKIQGTHRWHINSDIADGSTIGLNAANALYVPAGGITAVQLASNSVGSGAVEDASLRVKDTGAYKWKKVPVTDQLTEQTVVTASGQLVIGNLDSGQSALPTFSGTIKVTIESQYQERVAYISTAPTVSGGNVTFGLTLSPSGNNASDGAVYYDITVEQL